MKIAPSHVSMNKSNGSGESRETGEAGDQSKRIADVAFSIKIADVSIAPRILQAHAQFMPLPCHSHAHMRAAYALLMPLHALHATTPQLFHKRATTETRSMAWL